MRSLWAFQMEPVTDQTNSISLKAYLKLHLSCLLTLKTLSNDFKRKKSFKARWMFMPISWCWWRVINIAVLPPNIGSNNSSYLWLRRLGNFSQRALCMISNVLFTISNEIKFMKFKKIELNGNINTNKRVK